MSRGARARHDFGELVFDTRVEAEEVLDAMFNEISQYDVVTVRALLELCDYETNAVDRRWGWTDIRGTDIVRMRDGSYLLDLRPPEPIE